MCATFYINMQRVVLRKHTYDVIFNEKYNVLHYRDIHMLLLTSTCNVLNYVDIYKYATCYSKVQCLTTHTHTYDTLYSNNAMFCIAPTDLCSFFTAKCNVLQHI